MNKEKDKSSVSICRIASLGKFDNVLLGRDMAGIFKPGHVYGVRKIGGTILFDDLGEHATAKYLEGSVISAYAVSGIHCLTKAEYKNEQEKEES